MKEKSRGQSKGGSFGRRSWKRRGRNGPQCSACRVDPSSEPDGPAFPLPQISTTGIRAAAAIARFLFKATKNLGGHSNENTQ